MFVICVKKSLVGMYVGYMRKEMMCCMCVEKKMEKASPAINIAYIPQFKDFIL